MKIQEIPHRVHFVGIGGVGMSGLAQHLHHLGYEVSGSDRAQNDRTDALAQLGVKIHIGHRAENISNAQMIVRTSAVHLDNVEVAEANRLHIPVVLREQLLGAIFNSFSTRIAVCGTHGKTTVTAMIHEILSHCNVSHTAFIGGVYHGNNYFFGDGVVVAEACEFNRSFYNLNPTVTVCLNAEHDHPDCYVDVADVQQAFAHFMLNTDVDGYVVLPYALRKLCCERKCVYFDRHFNVSNLVFNDGKACFDVELPNEGNVPFHLGVVGAHNVNNALAALAIADILRLPFQSASKALHSFCGVERRWTEYKIHGLNVVCDYAHHPTELACSVATAKSIAKGKVVCIFQPHTYSRTKAFFEQFANCFEGVDNVVYLPIYSAREMPIDEINSQRLARIARQKGINAQYMTDFTSVAQWVTNNLSQDDLLLILGAGDIYQLADML